MFLEPIAPGAEELFGDCPIERFNATAVRILRDRRADKPEAANNRVKRLRRIFAWALESGIPGVTVNPARDVPLLKPKRVGGFPTWTPDDIERFEKRHPIGSKARLALALLMFTGVRRSDVVSLGRQHVRQGVLVFRQYKGRNRAPFTLDLPILPVLESIIDVSQTGDLSFLVTEQGKPFTQQGLRTGFVVAATRRGCLVYRPTASARRARRGLQRTARPHTSSWRYLVGGRSRRQRPTPARQNASG